MPSCDEKTTKYVKPSKSISDFMLGSLGDHGVNDHGDPQPATMWHTTTNQQKTKRKIKLMSARQSAP